jgi:flagellar hook-associated protein 3 FlgL
MAFTIDPGSQQFLDSINRIQTVLNTAQTQLASGRKVNQPSDAPDAVSPILQLHAQIQRSQDIQDSLAGVQTTVNTSQSVLSNAVDLLQNASVIATQATSTGQTPQTLATLAQSVQGIMQQMVATANTAVNGKYVFSGDQDQVMLYQLDPTNTVNGVIRAQIATNGRLVQGPAGQQFSASLTANDIFDARTTSDPVNPDAIAPQNVFAALTSLQTALQNNDQAGIQASISALDTVSSYMNSELQFYGQAQDRLTQAVSQSQDETLQYRTQLSGLQDADATQAITTLNQAQLQLQAAMQARARVPQTSLFDVLGN